MGRNLTRNIRKYKNGQKDHPDYLLYWGKRKMEYVVWKIHVWSCIKAIPCPTNTKPEKILADDALKKYKEVSELKLLNFIALNKLIRAQEETVCF